MSETETPEIMNNQEIPETATHERDGDYYRFMDGRCQTFWREESEWRNCEGSEDVDLWIGELSEIYPASVNETSEPVTPEPVNGESADRGCHGAACSLSSSDDGGREAIRNISRYLGVVQEARSERLQNGGHVSSQDFLDAAAAIETACRTSGQASPISASFELCPNDEYPPASPCGGE